jgi:Lysyl oxidase
MDARLSRLPAICRLLRLGVIGSAIAAVFLVGALTSGASASGVTASATAKLPDLDQVAPSGLGIQHYGDGPARRYRIGFESAVQNIGSGPLVVIGNRADTTVNLMQADQVVVMSDATTRTYPAIGRLKYVEAKKLNGQIDHQHWHYLGFDHFEIRKSKTYRRVRKDQKQGFCLGDRYRVKNFTPPAGAAPPFTPSPDERCGLMQPGLLTVTSGISVGFGDNYTAHLEGQEIDITGIKPGKYILVHRTNADRKLRESNYSNDASSALIRFFYPNGRNHGPQVKVLKVCGNSGHCNKRRKRR